ncbi:MAG TPA: OsmC family peroxiredoxin [Saprospiraceae bacterium]|nr:OsmC family peroxiredoxin [Saprospiraceae bacterium]
MKRKATAVWQGTGKEGKGHLSTQSGVLKEALYSSSSRFEEGIGTNPEELVAAAHAGCFAMKLSFILTAAEFPPARLEAQATVTIESGTVTSSAIELKASVPGISAEKFEECVRDAQKNCPISKLLNAEISVVHTLNQ